MSDESVHAVQTEGDNLVLEDEIRIARDQVIALKIERSLIGEQIADVRDRMETLGVSKQAFDAALRYYEQDPDKRETYDHSYAKARSAMGVPLQTELFPVDTYPDEIAI
jgi:hypothetical protein